MRLHEFTDLEPYTVAIDDTGKFPDLLARSRPIDDLRAGWGIRRPQQSLRREPQSLRPDQQSRQRRHSVHSP